MLKLPEKPPGGLTPMQFAGALDDLAARVPVGGPEDERARGDRRRADQAAMLAELTSDPALAPLREKARQARRQFLLCEHMYASNEYQIGVLRQQLPARLDDLPAQRAKIEQLTNELPMLRKRLDELRDSHRTAVADVRRVVVPRYSQLVAARRARLELTKRAAKGLIAEATLSLKAVEWLSADIDKWAEE